MKHSFVTLVIVLLVSVLFAQDTTRSKLLDATPVSKCDVQAPDSATQFSIDSITLTINQYKHEVDSLQCLPQMPVKEFYAAARNLAQARSTLFLLVAKSDPDKAMVSYKAAQLYHQRALAFEQKTGIDHE
jgi:hypothetical protein